MSKMITTDIKDDYAQDHVRVGRTEDILEVER